MDILVTGATGFIGRHLVRGLVEKGYRCHCLIRNGLSCDEFFDHPKIQLVHGDVVRPETLNGIAGTAEVAYHLAGVGHVAAFTEEAYKSIVEVNVEGTKNIVEACGRNGVKRFIHFSSTAAMGLIRTNLIDETMPCEARTPYQKSKYLSELAALEAGKEFGVEVVILRPCMVYGPGGKGEFLKICQLIKKGMFPRIGLGQNLTPIVHVHDVTRAAIACLYNGKGGEVYLIASEASFPLCEIHKYITEAMNITRPYYYVPTPLAYSAAYMCEILARANGKPPVVSRKNVVSTVTGRVFDITKAKTELHYSPREILEEGVAETVRWYKENNSL